MEIEVIAILSVVFVIVLIIIGYRHKITLRIKGFGTDIDISAEDKRETVSENNGNLKTTNTEFDTVKNSQNDGSGGVSASGAGSVAVGRDLVNSSINTDARSKSGSCKQD